MSQPPHESVSSTHLEGGIYAASFAGALFKLAPNGETMWHLKARSIADFTVGIHRIFIATSAGEIAAIDKADGTVHWRFKMDKNLPTQIKRFGDYLIVPTSSGEVYLFDAFSGHVFEKWVGSSDAFLSELTFGANRFYGLSNAGRLVAFQMGW